MPVKPHPPMSGGPEPFTATQPQSFLRGTSSGERIEQQHSNAFRAKPNTHARMQRYSTQFNELDFTPNRPEEKAQCPMANKADVSQALQSHADESSTSSSFSSSFSSFLAFDEKDTNIVA
ncbi:hypothetical protein H0G86_000337 [Trichoderma simmonsii]|uniref:Uncharacterized protein n=1 Tax=Trichoderma simmonsii TaxID=1491479 RepID=A0A8G0L4Q9_9HYPO|nr:hypothetical protein H0G86_000337 [Trichoderma simmonsii]